VRERLDALIAGLGALIVVAERLQMTAAEIVVGGESLVETGRAVDRTGREIVSGGHDLDQTGRAVDRTGREIVAGGQDLIEVAASLDETLRVFRAALPRLLQGIDTAEQLEEAVETVAETVEPLQGAAKRVGRVTRRLSSDSR
jgi:hypothetical protein